MTILYRILFSTLFISLLISCASPGSSGEPSSEENEAEALVTDSVRREELKNCPRGVAKPVLDKSDLPDAKFTLQSDSLTGAETATLKNGDKLTLENWGCEYYINTFSIETGCCKDAPKTDSPEYWMKQAVTLMTQLIGAYNGPLDLKKGVMLLQSHVDADKINHYKNIQFGNEINISNTSDTSTSAVREYITVGKVEKTADGRYRFEITLSKGPLKN